MPARAKSSAKKRVESARERAFNKEARRQSLLANRSPHAAEDQAWMEEMVNSEKPDDHKKSN